MSDPELTLHDVADELGVHYMTAYRYVRTGLLPATKVGTSWVVRRADLDALRASTPRRGTGRSSKGDGRWESRLEARLIAGDLPGAWNVLESSLAAGSDLESVYLDVIAPALRGIGDRWQNGEIDVAVEHRASGIATKLLGRMSSRFGRRGRSRGTVVLGGAPGERHGLPVTLVADLVRAAGFDADDLGPDVPGPSLARAGAAATRLVAIGVSVTTPGLDGAVRGAVRSIRADLPGVPILLGGAAVGGVAHAQELGADHYAGDARGVIGVLDALTRSRRSTEQ
jgi:MerR family transcriptional regulator, light-induced transcriptional regulator